MGRHLVHMQEDRYIYDQCKIERELDMKYKQRNRILALILSLTLLVGLFPATTVVAAEPPVEGVPTSMRLQRAFVAQGISSYFQTDDNHYASFYESPVTLGYDCYSPLQWMLLSFALINNQNVSLTLWELDESHPSFDENPIVLEPDLTNADAIEPFLKGDSPIGYLRGIRITDNVAESDSEGYYTHVEMTPTEINEACVRALLDVVRVPNMNIQICTMSMYMVHQGNHTSHRPQMQSIL